MTSTVSRVIWLVPRSAGGVGAGLSAKAGAAAIARAKALIFGLAKGELHGLFHGGVTGRLLPSGFYVLL
jgi:hypothetical protein